MQRLGAEFPVPDTLFFTRKANPASLFACRIFSPYLGIDGVAAGAQRDEINFLFAWVSNNLSAS
jgi:hypothetical protein